MIAVNKELKIENKKINVNDGSIAIGHPLGASGSRILVMLFHEMKINEKIKTGIASLCIGGGMCVVILITKKQRRKNEKIYCNNGSKFWYWI